MLISKQTIRFILCALVISIAAQSAIEAYPYAYQRLILKKNGKIVKIVDLIGDTHIPEIANKPRLLGPSEKTLLATFQKISTRTGKGKIELLGESRPENIKYFQYLKQWHSTSGLWLILHKLHARYNLH